jgi:hypothetical protein
MIDNKRFSASKAILAGIFGLGVCITLVILVTRTPTDPSVATVSFSVLKPVFSTHIKELQYHKYGIVKEGEHYKATQETQTVPLLSKTRGMVPEGREQMTQVPMSKKEILKLYVIGLFAILFGVYFFVLIFAWARTLITNKTPPRYLQEHFNKGVSVICGILGGFLLAPEIPQNAQVSIPQQEVQFEDIIIDPNEWASMFQRTMTAQEDNFLRTLEKLHVEVPARPDSAADSEISIIKVLPAPAI